MFNFKSSTLVLIVTLLSACGSNEFKQNYKGDLYSPTKEATVITSVQSGLQQIGSSSFMSSNRSGDSQAVTTARAVGADYVTWQSKYIDSSTHQGARSIPTTTTTYNSGSVYSADGGYGSYTGSSTSRGTSYVPYSYTLNWYSYSANFYRSMDLSTNEFGIPINPIGKTKVKKKNGIPIGTEWEYFELTEHGVN